MVKTLEQRVAELEKQMDKITRSNVVRISKSIEVGDTFELAGLTWTILDTTDNGYMCLAGRLNERMIFDSDHNNWKESDLRNYLNTDFYKKLSESVGDDNIIPFERDLLSLDGQTEYGVCEDKVSLLTVDEYRKYRSMVPNTDEYWWWLITPWSTPCNEYKTTVAVVSSSGNINNNNCNNNNGVRPFCITQTVRVGIKPKSEYSDTKRCVTFPKWVNTKEFSLWIKILFAILKICIRLIAKRNLVKDLIAAVQSFRL